MARPVACREYEARLGTVEVVFAEARHRADHELAHKLFEARAAEQHREEVAGGHEVVVLAHVLASVVRLFEIGIGQHLQYKISSRERSISERKKRLRTVLNEAAASCPAEHTVSLSLWRRAPTV